MSAPTTIPTDRDRTIVEIFNRTQTQYGAIYTRALVMETTCARAFMAHGWELEHSDVERALEAVLLVADPTKSVPSPS